MFSIDFFENFPFSHFTYNPARRVFKASNLFRNFEDEETKKQQQQQQQQQQQFFESQEAFKRRRISSPVFPINDRHSQPRFQASPHNDETQQHSIPIQTVNKQTYERNQRNQVCSIPIIDQSNIQIPIERRQTYNTKFQSESFQSKSLDDEQALNEAISKSIEQNKIDQINRLPTLIQSSEWSKVQARIGKIISPEAFETLNGDSQLSSDIINAFVELVVTKSNSQQKKLRWQLLNTYFCSYLARWYNPSSNPTKLVEDDPRESQDLLRELNYCEEQIQKYSSRLKFEENSMIVIPIHVPGHWVLAIIDCKQLVVEFYDSMGGNGWFEFWKNAISSWLHSSNFINSQFRKRLAFENLQFENVTKYNRHQTQGFGCGVFVCYYLLNRILLEKTAVELSNDPNSNPQFISEIFRPYLRKQLIHFVENRSL